MNPLFFRVTTLILGLAANALLSACSNELLRVVSDMQGQAIAAAAPCVEEYGDDRPLTPGQIMTAAHLGFPQSLATIRRTLGQPSIVCGARESYALPHGGYFNLTFDAQGQAISSNWSN